MSFSLEIEIIHQEGVEERLGRGLVEDAQIIKGLVGFVDSWT